MASDRRILRSWKEIASYLGVGVRTAQRWKTLLGLPIRQPGASRRTAVLGFSDEIDRWLGSSRLARHDRASEVGEVIATDLLWSRSGRPREADREILALLEIGRLMAGRDAGAVLKKIAKYALTLCKAESAGFSILETDESGREIFRWTATCGRMQPFEGGATPADFSPCGVCIETNSPQLFRYPEKFYAYLQPIAPLSEVLLIPMYDDNAGVGTIWIISHRGRRKFDPEDTRLMKDLGVLASAALRGERRFQT